MSVSENDFKNMYAITITNSQYVNVLTRLIDAVIMFVSRSNSFPPISNGGCFRIEAFNYQATSMCT